MLAFHRQDFQFFNFPLDYHVRLCSSVFVSNTVYVPVRMRPELVRAIDLRAARENRKRSQMIVVVLEEVFREGGDAVRGDAAVTADSRNRAGRGTPAEIVTPVESSDLAIERTGGTAGVVTAPGEDDGQRVDSLSKPRLRTDAIGTTGGKVTIATQIPGVTRASQLPMPSRPAVRACPECGSLGGMHQKGCSKR